MLLQSIDRDPIHLVVSQGPRREVDRSRNSIAAQCDNAVDAAVNLFFGLGMISVRCFGPDDMHQLNSFRGGRPHHHIRRLLLAVDFSAVGYGGTIRQVERVICRVVPMPELLLVPGRLYNLLLEYFEEIGGLGKTCTRGRCGPEARMMHCNMPAGRSTEGETSHDQAIFID